MHALKQSAVAPSGIRLGGRAWRPICSDAVREKARAWIAPQLEDHGIRMQAQPCEAARAFAEGLYRQLCLSPVVFPLLGSLLVLDDLTDEEWIPQLAITTGEFLHHHLAECDQDMLQAVLVSWSLGQGGIGLKDFLGLSPLASNRRM